MCRGYFILLSLIWGIYVDKTLVSLALLSCLWIVPSWQHIYQD